MKAIVLRINSGGGSALASDIIWREADLASRVKPLIASFSDVAASGGYYIAAPADTILAHPNTITGSIGVFAMLPNAQGFFNKKLGITIDVAKTNKHADLGSIFRPLSGEEKEIILPALAAAGKENVLCEGPLSADTAFLAENRKRFSAFVAMYHAQALLAVKLLLFRKSVNITLGTPIIRTSVDHGTAFPLAGTGKADPASLIQAIKMARQLADRQGGKE